MQEHAVDHFGQWWAVGLWIVLFAVFLAFIPFYKKSQRKPASVYLAFIVALALEMFGVPLSMYFLTAVLGRSIPEGVFWGHTLSTWIGENGETLSGGQRKKLLLAQALLKNPQLLVVDEPSAGISTENAIAIFRNIREHYPEMAILMATHLRDFEKVVDRIVEL